MKWTTKRCLKYVLDPRFRRLLKRHRPWNYELMRLNVLALAAGAFAVICLLYSIHFGG